MSVAVPEGVGALQLVVDDHPDLADRVGRLIEGLSDIDPLTGDPSLAAALGAVERLRALDALQELPLLGDDTDTAVWGELSESAAASLEVLVARIRRKLGTAASVLQTRRGLGYTLQADE